MAVLPLALFLFKIPLNPTIKKRLLDSETNLDLMENGNAPIGVDERKIELYYGFAK